MDSHEYIIFARRGKAKKINNCGDRSVFNIKNTRDKKHPSEKPIELMEKLILNSSNKGDIVLDPFLGAGSTAIACKNTGRQYIGIELDDKYFDIATERINNLK